MSTTVERTAPSDNPALYANVPVVAIGFLDQSTGALVPITQAVGIPTTGGGGGGGGAVTVADGADIAIGATTDAIVAAGAAGSLSAKLRRLTSDLGSLLAKMFPGSAQTTANAMPVSLASDDAQVGAKTTGSSISAGGSGIIGWLSDAVTQLKTLVTGVIAKGGTASGVSVANAPLTIGGRAATTNPISAVTDGQVVNGMFDKVGRQVVAIGHVRQLIGEVDPTITDASSHTLIAAGGTNVFTDIVLLVMTNSSATTVTVAVTDGTLVRTYVVPAGGGIVIPKGPMTATSSNTAWSIQSSGAVTSLFVQAIYEKNL